MFKKFRRQSGSARNDQQSHPAYGSINNNDESPILIEVKYDEQSDAEPTIKEQQMNQTIDQNLKALIPSFIKMSAVIDINQSMLKTSDEEISILEDVLTKNKINDEHVKNHLASKSNDQEDELINYINNHYQFNEKHQLAQNLESAVNELMERNNQIKQKMGEQLENIGEKLDLIQDRMEGTYDKQQASANTEPPRPSKKMQALRLLSCGIFGKQTKHSQDNTEEATPINNTKTNP